MKLLKHPVYTLVLFVVLIFLSGGCHKDNDSIPELLTVDASDFTYQSASCGGNITSDGGAKVLKRGVCWSTEQNPDTTNIKLADTTGGAGNFKLSLTNLPANTTIYVRAYAINNQGISYGNEISFILWLNSQQEPVTDFDNNSYSTVKIGNQIWMTENLKVTHYRNGDPVPNITLQSDPQWLSTISGAYCSYEDNSENSQIYGYLYNGYAVTDSRNLCPAGWHIPAQKEWETLVAYLDNYYNAGNLLKSLAYWDNLNVQTSNMSGFSALPGGSRLHPMPDRTYTIFYGLKSHSYFWSKDEYHTLYYPDGMWYIQMMNTTNWAMIDNNITKKCGLSIRCIKD
jgi:uncharacterized protein (TIGR02145 family)